MSEISKNTFSNIRLILSSFNLELLDVGLDGEIAKNVATKGFYHFKCLKCGEVWGDNAYLYKVLAGIKTCICVKKENFNRRGFERRGKATPAMVAAGLAKKGKKRTTAHHEAACLAAKNRYHVSYFDIAEQLLKTGSYPVVPFEGLVSTTEEVLCCCSCQKLFTARALDLKLGMTRSCGCLKSYPETELFEFVKQLAPDAERNKYGVIKYYDGGRRQLDVWVPSKKFAIELDSSWHGELILNKRGHHKLSSFHKNRICRENGIRLMTIYADEWITKKDIVKNYIKSVICPKNFIGARKCEIVKGGDGFIKKYHIQGGSLGETFSLMYNGKVVAAATFKSLTGPRAAGLKNVYTLTRYCVNEVSVSGGLRRLISHFWKINSEVKTVISFSDNRLSAGILYQKSGFTKLEENEPSYYYYVNRKRCDKSGFRKDSLKKRNWILPGETEWECMQRMGYDRVWDCGKIKWGLDRPAGL